MEVNRIRLVFRATHKLTIAVAIGLLPVLVWANPSVQINEVAAGINGDSNAQFVEIVVAQESDKQWGPQGSELVGRMMLAFYGSNGQQTGRYVFDADAPGGAKTVLVATSGIAVQFPDLVPDFVMPQLVRPQVGKVCIRSNPDNAAYTVQHCLSYGGNKYTGQTEAIDGANLGVLPILDVQSLSRSANFSSSSPLNSDYQLTTPTPASTQSTGEESDLRQNLIGERAAPAVGSVVVQGKTLFFNETFLGNGRTCGTCHHASDAFGLNPSTVARLPHSDPLFIHERNVNKIMVSSIGSVNPSGSGAQPSDFRLGDVLTGSLGGTAKVLSGSGSTYYIDGGEQLFSANNVVSDSAGNSGIIVSYFAGNLNQPAPFDSRFGLESSQHLRGGRALIVVNADGFTSGANLRNVPSLLATSFGRGVGQSRPPRVSNGGLFNSADFSANAVKQHLTKSTARVADRDFRPPTSEEADALADFIDSLTPFPWIERFNPDPSLRPDIDIVNDFSTTEAQQRGAKLFRQNCRSCHSGWAGGSTIDVNTRVSEREINTRDQLPTEQVPGQPPNSRRFFRTPLLGLTDSAPYFHDNSSPTLEDVVLFYEPDFIPRDVQSVVEFLTAIRYQPFSFSHRVLELGFVHLDKGATEPKSFTFTNTGDKSMLVSNIQLFGQRFSSGPFRQRGTEHFERYDFVNDFTYTHDAPESGVLQPNQSINFEVTFDPSGEVEFLEFVEARSAIEFDVAYENQIFRAGAVIAGDRGSIQDRDRDGFDWHEDNCRDTYNPSQSDVDGDGRGDVCDDNADGDNWHNEIDNCPLVSNNTQADFDDDGDGDACDLDDDNDRLPDIWEKKHGLNSRDQNDAKADKDGDGYSNLAEYRFGSDPNKADSDSDQNGVPDAVDRRRTFVKIMSAIMSVLD